MREILKKYTEETKNWLVMNSSAVPYIISFGIRQWTKGVNDQYPENRLMDFCGLRYTKGGSEAQYFTNNDFYRRSFKKLINNTSVLEKIYEDFLKNEKNFKIFVDKIESKGEDYLHAHFDDFIAVYDAEYISGVVIDGILVYSEAFFSEMKQKYPAYEKELNILIGSYGETFLARYKKELFIIAIETCGNYTDISELLKNNEVRKDLERVQKSFHWIQNNYKNVEALSVEFFAEQLLELFQKDKDVLIKELNELNEVVGMHQKECEQIKEKSVFSSEDFDKLFWIGKIGWWVDRRKEYNLLSSYYIGRYLKWICQKHGMIYEDASFLLPSEVEQIENGVATIADFPVDDRKNESIHMYDIDGNETIVIGDEAKEFWGIVNPEVKKNEGNEVKGMIAYKGKVRGVVRVVMDAYNPGEFNEGDILITGMTRPDFLSLMKKAAAFVTDEGGITCHAAIVARELKTPCVIGTKIATKVFKNGDFVEVDADNGVVRIIKFA